MKDYVSIAATILLCILIVIAFTGCNSGAGVIELISAQSEEGQKESVCVRGGIKGTFTQTDLMYVKKSWPDGAEEPEC